MLALILSYLWPVGILIVTTSTLVLSLVLLITTGMMLMLVTPKEGGILFFFMQEVSLMTILTLWLLGETLGLTCWVMLKMANVPFHWWALGYLDGLKLGPFLWFMVTMKLAPCLMLMVMTSIQSGGLLPLALSIVTGSASMALSTTIKLMLWYSTGITTVMMIMLSKWALGSALGLLGAYLSLVLIFFMADSCMASTSPHIPTTLMIITLSLGLLPIFMLKMMLGLSLALHPVLVLMITTLATPTYLWATSTQYDYYYFDGSPSYLPTIMVIVML